MPGDFALWVEITGTGGLGGRSSHGFDVRFVVPDTFQPSHIENFQIRHVSQESFGQTADNWDLRQATVDIIPPPPSAIRVGNAGPHRFDGSHRVLTTASRI